MTAYEVLQQAAMQLAIKIVDFEMKGEGTVPLVLKPAIANVVNAACDVEDLKIALRERLTSAQEGASM